MLTSMALTMHDAQAVSDYAGPNQVELVLTNFSNSDTDMLPKDGLDAACNEHCLTHTMVIIPTGFDQHLITRLTEKNIASSNGLFFDNFFQLLRPPKN